ncbi:MAG: ribonucleoside-diphosphate reductase subunit alpha [Thermoanaerobaculia bacterium]|nr:ribonucleoside-diphosphate reductase subunit alpha [Thermoanaerobaculia bacterium]
MQDLRVVKRTGEVVEFDPDRIQAAIAKAVDATNHDVAETKVEKVVDDVTQEVRSRFVDFFPNVENIQDIVEKHLVTGGFYEVSKAFILYRAERQKAREEATQRAIESAKLGKLTVKKRDGRVQLLNVKKLDQTLRRAAVGLGDDLQFDQIIREVVKNVYDEVETTNIDRALVLATAAFIERDPNYSYLAARLLLQRLVKEVVGRSITDDEHDAVYRETFVTQIKVLVERGLLDPRLGDYDLERLAAALRPERDLEFQYLGIQTLYERYFLRKDERVAELPQTFWMRVAMGLALQEDESQRTDWAIEFYELMSQRRFVASTPTLFHSGTDHPQLSSCYLTTVDDDLKHIFKCLGDNSQLSKWSGGIGNDWSNIRATGAAIKSTKVESQGVIPFLKIANDVTNAINRSGKRRGATCAYLETWHYDIEDFLDLRKNTGDERRRTHDMNTANWIPDLFMKRVVADQKWMLFSPDEVPDLHRTYGRDFEQRYESYERKAKLGEMRLFKVVEARSLWRKMLTMLFETGHPWITFKDACNVRSPQDHVGVIHSSNLCTEITLNTSSHETAVCNLGSINLLTHMDGPELNRDLLAQTVKTAIRLLDNVIDINFYPTPEARDSNLRHRPIGLGLMGFQDTLFLKDLAFESEAALDFADATQEWISYHAILASSELAAERGSYGSFEGSKWHRGILPVDTIDLLEQERGVPVEVSRTQRLDWDVLRQHIAEHGMRNSNTMAVAPTATISNISGCFPCIEPIYKNIYVKANISGEFTIVNRYLVDDLKALGLWDGDMLDRLKYYDGDISRIDDIPQHLKEKYKEAFDVDPVHCLRLTAARGKWIDQSQSHNVFMQGKSGKKLQEIYLAAWKMGLKTTYYLRTLAATQIEKSTLDATKFGYTQKREYDQVAAKARGDAAAKTPERPVGAPPAGATGRPMQEPAPLHSKQPEPQLCRIDDPDCEACQ